eukprot:TRINITY_DN4308_c0_g1_i1.p1 TRINITY_DN4308_c0_g1~~TRINITY_DN4308_c0_g1_i1.p1  ORF type:complete len:547 (+),score=115.72 TRINITY_DN4308_c0_g1_i1:1322-2962(+)
MMVHHSRNSIAKQWDETQVVALSGVSRIFKVHFLYLVNLPQFAKNWMKLMELYQFYAVSPSAEVSVASVNALSDVVMANISNASFTRDHWHIVGETWGNIVHTAALVENGSEKPLVSLSNSITELYQKHTSRFDTDDVKRLLRILHSIGLYRSPEFIVEGELSSLQKTVLKVIKQLQPVSDEIFPFLFEKILDFISSAIGYQLTASEMTPNQFFLDGEENGGSTTDGGAGESTSHPFSALVPALFLRTHLLPLAQHSTSILVELYEKCTNPNLRALVLPDAIKVLGAAMMTKYVSHNHPLWKKSLSSLILITKTGLNDLNTSKIASDRAKLVSIWMELTCILHHFLLYDRTGMPQMSSEVHAEDERLDLQLLDHMSHHVLEVSGRIPFVVHKKMVDIFRRGTCLDDDTRRLFSYACYGNMFLLCAKGGKHDDLYSCHMSLARLVMPMIMKRCQEVLVLFVQDEKKLGNCPLPRHRLEEVRVILTELLKLKIHPEVVDSEIRGKSGNIPHLLVLFPLLCDVITTREPAIKELLQVIFHEIAKELNLE